MKDVIVLPGRFIYSELSPYTGGTVAKQKQFARSETTIADRESLRKFAVEEDTSLLTGFVSARLETVQDKNALTSLISVLRRTQDATVNAFLDLWLTEYQATN